MSRLKHLKTLSRLLAGDPPPEIDWLPTLALANASLVTPDLYAAALRAGTVASMPPDVRACLREVWRRNRERNRRLFTQLGEAISALNAADVEPLLLKGAAQWVALGRPEPHDRMLTDLDLAVAPEETGDAVAALERAGFRTRNRYDRPESYVAAELARDEDVGLIDLHRRPPGPQSLVQTAMAFPGQTRAAAWPGLRARIPTPALQIFLLVLHDQFQDGGYWRGEFALRHLIETAALFREPGRVDWDVVAQLASGRLVRNVVDAQLLAAATLCGAPAPKSARRLWVRLQHTRLRAQFAWPQLSPILVLGSG